MANDLNRHECIGRLGQDPEMKYLSDGKAVCNLSVACSSSWKDKNTGSKEERTEWIRYVAFGKLAEIMGEYLRKGSKIYLSGELRTRKWQDDSGADRYSTEIVANDMQMLDSKNDSAPTQQPAPQQASPQKAPAPSPAAIEEYTMTPEAEGYTRQQYLDMNWTDQQLIEQGYMVQNPPF